MRIVIADDVERALFYAKQGLEAAGHEVVGEAANGREAVELCERLRPDGVLLDISMPVMDGKTAAIAILGAKTAQHVFVSSNLSQKAVMARLRELGCIIVTKPYDKPRLVREIEQVLCRNRTDASTTP